MFGYIKPYKPELKIKDYDIFRAYYCGLCKEIGKRYGEISRFTLNYELTYLAIFLSGLSNEKINMAMERCIANPFKKKPIIENNPFIQYAADMNSILVYYKFVDMKKDNKNILSGAMEALFRRQYIKSYRRYPYKAQIIKKYLDDLCKLENEKCDKVDIAAEPFANILKEVFAYDYLDVDKDSAKNIKEIAYHLGRFIYIIDAYNDMEEDIKRSNYNPFVLQFNYNGMDYNIKKEIDDWTNFNLTFTLSNIANIYERIKFKKNIGIIENIFKIGLFIEFRRIVEGEKSCKTHMKY